MTATAPLLSERYGRLSNLPLRPRQVSPFTSHPSTALTLHKFRPSPDRVSRGSPLRGLGHTSSPNAPRALQGCPALQSACGRYRRIERRGARPPGPFGPAQQVQTGRSSGADRRSLATTNRLSPTSAGNSCSTGAIEGKRLVKSCPLCRGNRESPEQMSGAPGGDAPLLSCARDEGISLAFGTKPGGGSSLGLWQRTSASKVSPMALGLRISEATNWGSLVPRQASAAL